MFSWPQRFVASIRIRAPLSDDYRGQTHAARLPHARRRQRGPVYIRTRVGAHTHTHTHALIHALTHAHTHAHPNMYLHTHAHKYIQAPAHAQAARRRCKYPALTYILRSTKTRYGVHPNTPAIYTQRRFYASPPPRRASALNIPRRRGAYSAWARPQRGRWPTRRSTLPSPGASRRMRRRRI